MKNINFPLLNTSQLNVLQSNPNFSCPQKSEKIHKYSLNHRAPSWAKILHIFLEYFCYRKYFLFWTEMMVSTATTILLAPLCLNFLVHHHLSRRWLASKAQAPTASHLTSVTSQRYWLETYLACKIFSTASRAKPKRGNIQNYHEQHARHEVWA